MSILVNANTKVITQGMTGETGTFHTEQALAYGTKMVGGVTPGKGGTTHIGLPVFDTVAEAVDGDRRRRERDLRAAALRRGFDPRGDRRRGAADRRITEGIPVLDMVRVKRALSGSKSRLIGPELPRRADAGRVQDRHHARLIFTKGSVGVVSRSGTLTYEAVFQTTNAGLGQTTAVGIGGDPVNGTNFIDVLELFLADEATKSIIMIGEIGGSAEEEAAQFLADEAKRAARSRWSASSPAAPRRRAAAWAMPARSSRAARAAPRTRSRRWRRLESRVSAEPI